MWTQLLHALGENIGLANLFVVMVGTVVGMVIGALPGLSAVSGVALVLPFTFTMEPSLGLIMLGSVYMAAEYGGSISAILINTPGTSGAACTTLDGYPFTRKGQAQEALYTSLFASTVGGTFGALVLIFMTPLLARASLLLGPAEMFWIAVSGLAMVASLSGRHTIKGMIGALIGIGLTLIGQDAISGDMRFTFDNYRLVGGIPLIPALLGLFAIANILSLLEQPHKSVAPLIIRKGVIKAVILRLANMKRLLLWTSTLGTLIGVIPGAGASIAAFVAYAEAKRVSKNRDEFGTGVYEGVAAPESANNASVGGALVPLLALGIPGSGSAAVMFGALTIHGLIPGPRLFSERGDIVFTFMVGILFTVAAMLIVGLLSIRWSSLIVHVPRKAMVPAVLILSVIGTYGLDNSLFDVYVLLVIGFTSYVLTKIDIPAVTIALGLVLGRIMEESFQQAALVGKVDMGSTWLYFASRPIAMVLMVVAFGILATGISQIIRARKIGLPETEPADGEPGRGMSLRTANIILGGVLLALAAFIHVEAIEFSAEGALFPRLVADAFVLLGGVLAAININPKTGLLRAYGRPFSEIPWRFLLIIMLALSVLAVGADYIGFYECAFLFLLFVFWLLASDISRPLHRFSLSLAFAFGFAGLTYLAFKIVLEIATPPGLLL